MSTLAQVLFIPGPLPGMNEMLNAHGTGGGGKGNGYARAKKKWTNDIALLAKVHKLRPMERVRLRFVWHEKHRQRNPDNIAAGKKLVIDGLVVAKVLRNDGWDQIAGFVDDWRVGSPPGVLVIIEPVFVDSNVDRGGFARERAKGLLKPNGKDDVSTRGKDAEDGSGINDGGGNTGMC